MAETLEQLKQVPSWWADMEFCHIAHPDSDAVYCGDVAEADMETCPGWCEGEAVCPECGLPTCPRCAQLCALEDSLYEEEFFG